MAGDCDKNLRYVHDTCPASCGLCALRRAKAAAQAVPTKAQAQAYPDAMAGMGSMASATAGSENRGGEGSHPSATELERQKHQQRRSELQMLHRQLQAEQQQQQQQEEEEVEEVDVNAAAATLNGPTSAMAGNGNGGGAAPQLVLTVPDIIGAAESADVSLKFHVEPVRCHHNLIHSLEPTILVPGTAVCNCYVIDALCCNNALCSHRSSSGGTGELVLISSAHRWESSRRQRACTTRGKTNSRTVFLH